MPALDPKPKDTSQAQCWPAAVHMADGPVVKLCCLTHPPPHFPLTPQVPAAHLPGPTGGCGGEVQQGRPGAAAEV